MSEDPTRRAAQYRVDRLVEQDRAAQQDGAADQDGAAGRDDGAGQDHGAGRDHGAEQDRAAGRDQSAGRGRAAGRGSTGERHRPGERHGADEQYGTAQQDRAQQDRTAQQDSAAEEAGAPEGSAAARSRMERRGEWADELVRQAMARGEFDDLAYAGKPIPGLDGRHDPDWWVKGLVERKQISGVLPEALQLRKDAAALDARLDRERTPDEVRRLVDEFNARVVAARRQLLGGPPVVTPTRDVEAEVARWADRRRERAAAAEERRRREIEHVIEHASESAARDTTRRPGPLRRAMWWRRPT